jgi:TetR/AcrR family transcriptional regulator, mexJK operon transcriptional repressor
LARSKIAERAGDTETMSSAGVASRRGRPTAQDAQLKLAQMLAVAREMFCNLGYRAVTMREVADKAQVSTRTLYNHYADKLSLFVACLDFGAEAFPKFEASAGADVRDQLEEHAAAVVRVLSQDTSLQLGMLVYREGGDFPELLRASEENQQRVLVEPIAAYLRTAGLAQDGAESLAKLFIAMALSEWQRRITYRHPMPSEAEIRRHARTVSELFLRGVGAVGGA